jgi:aminopeptidase
MMETPAPDFERIAWRILHTVAGVKPGWNVTIRARPDAQPLVDALAVESYKSGAPAAPVVWSDDFLCRCIAEVPLEYLKAGLPHLGHLLRVSDLVIQLDLFPADPTRVSALPPERVAARREGMAKLRDIVLDGSRRWIATEFPTPGQARTFGLDFKTFSGLFWRAIDIDYDALKRTCDAVQSVFAGGHRVHITSAKGTDLVLDYAGRPVFKDDGVIDDDDFTTGKPFCNLPAGEVCLAPVEEATRGRAVFDRAFWDGKWMRDVEVEFGPGGVARPVRAGSGLEEFLAVIDNAPGASRLLGELGIGLNPAVDRDIGFVLVDEKYAGTVHLALGENIHLGGKNKSPLHWDILILKPTVVVGKTTIIRDGELQVGGR